MGVFLEPQAGLRVGFETLQVVVIMGLIFNSYILRLVLEVESGL